MTPNPALQQLKDIHLPLAIPRWLIAPGWIMLYAVAFILFAYSIYYWQQRKRRRRVICYALQQLNHLHILQKQNPDNINVAAEISTLIRRTALHYFQRAAIAGLSGQDWLEFLNTSGNTTAFTESTGQLLLDAPYRKPHAIDLEPLFSATENWLHIIGKLKRKEQ